MQQTQRMQQKLSISAIELMKYSQRLIRCVFFSTKIGTFYRELCLKGFKFVIISVYYYFIIYLSAFLFLLVFFH